MSVLRLTFMGCDVVLRLIFMDYDVRTATHFY